jgi:NADH-quinone oxidoreductase subunit M
MIQRIFYGRLGLRPEEVTGWDLTAREHLELWPLAALFLIMGVASPLWMKAIDTYGAPTAGKVTEIAPGWYKNTETGAYSVNHAEINAYCQSHPCHFRAELRVIPNKEVR